MSDPYPIDPNTGSSIDLATVIEVLADDPKVVGDRSDYHPTRGRVVKETPSGNRWLGDGDQWISLESNVGLSSPSVSTENLDNIVMGSETIDSIQSVASAIDEVAGTSGRSEVWIVGEGEHPASYDKATDLSKTTIKTKGGAVWTNPSGSGDWLFYPQNGFDDGELDITVNPNGERSVTIPSDSDAVDVCYRTDGTPTATTAHIRVGDSTGGKLNNLSIDIKHDGANNDGATGIVINEQTEGLEIEGQVRKLNAKVMENNGFSLDRPQFSLYVQDCGGPDLTGGAINHGNISLTCANVAAHGIKCTPEDAVVEVVGTMQKYGIWIVDGRDSKLRGSMEDGFEWGVRVQRTEADEYNDAAKHDIDVQCSNFAKDGCFLEGAVECDVQGQFNQNSKNNSGTYSGVRLASVTVNSTTFTPDDNTIDVQAHDNHDTKTQSHGVDIEAGTDNTVNGNLKYNLNAGLNDNGTSTTTAATLKQ